MDESLFLRALLKDRVKLRPHELNGNVRDTIAAKLRARVDGVCTRHGLVRPGSVDIVKVSMGRVEMAMLNGDTTYQVQYCADVCNPLAGSVVRARIVNMNKFGILCEAGLTLEDGRRIPVLEIIVARQTVELQSEVDLDALHINDDVSVEVLGKKFSIGATKISVVGRVLKNGKGPRSSGSGGGAALPSLEDEQDESDNGDDSGDLDEEPEELEEPEEPEEDQEDGAGAAAGTEAEDDEDVKEITLVEDSEAGGGFYDDAEDDGGGSDKEDDDDDALYS